MKYLVDSDWLIDTMMHISGASETLERLSADGLAVAIITLGELFDGMMSHPNVEERLEEVRDLVAAYTVLGLSDQTMVIFAHRRSNLRRQGRLISDLDLIIAATAIEHDLTLITRNLRHFERIPDLSIYVDQDDI